MISQAGDELGRRHHAQQMAGTTLLHQGRGHAHIERSGRHQVFAQSGEQVRRHVVEIRLDDSHPCLGSHLLADPDRQRVAWRFACSDAIADRSQRQRRALEPGDGGEDGRASGRHQLAPALRPFEDGAGAFEHTDTGGRRQRHRLLTPARRRQRRGIHLADIQVLEQPERTHEVDQGVRAAELVQVERLL